MKLAPAFKFLALRMTCLKAKRRQRMQTITVSRKTEESAEIHESKWECKTHINHRKRLPFSDHLLVRRLIRSHELWHEVSENANENHDDGQRDQHPISDWRVQYQIFRHGRSRRGRLRSERQRRKGLRNSSPICGFSREKKGQPCFSRSEILLLFQISVTCRNLISD